MEQKSDPELVRLAKEVITDKEMDTTSNYYFTYVVWQMHSLLKNGEQFTNSGA